MGQGATAPLEQRFVSPPADASAWTYYYGCNGNLTREAITADLEAMHRAGIRGILYMAVDLYIPDGPVRFMSPEWRDLMQHMMREADRLGIILNFNNDGGWAGSGGPWITPELSMQVVVWSETVVEGPGAVSTTLAQPQTVHDYYKDIAVLAFPVPSGDGKRMMDYSPRLTYGTDRKEFDFSKLVDGNPGTTTVLPLPQSGPYQCVNIDFAEPFTAQSVSVAIGIWNSGMATLAGAVQVSDDGANYRTIREMTVDWPNVSANFDPVSSRHYRILIGTRMMSDWSGFSRLLQHGLPVGQIQLHAGPRIEDIPGKALYLRQGAYSTENDVLSGQAQFPKDTVIPFEKVLDITDKADSSGLLKWEAPPGKWVVLRVGHTSTGAQNEPAPKESRGLECDKLSKRAIEAQFDGLVEKLLQDEAATGAHAIKMTHIDSWEVGSQNWTSDFREEFKARRGYDPLRYLPILTGRPIESGEQSERFLWDFRRTIGDLLLENYADHLKEIAHKRGLTLSIEGYGAGPFDEIAYGGRADMPIGEFWTGNDASSVTFNVSSKAMASSGHVYGRPVIGAEAFTAEETFAVWDAHPFQLKSLGDLAFTWGINRFVLNEFMVQRWPVTGPGITLGKWGSHLDRNNTWWEQSGAWLTYLARCQTLLQSGQFVADVAYLGSENTPYSGPWTKDLDPPLPPGYDYDFLPVEALLKDATVRDGRIVLTSGMSYRVLVLQPGYSLTPDLLRKLRQLVNDGATVVGPRPVQSPSLSNYPQCDTEVRQLADDLWGVSDGSSVNENRVGKGRTIWGEALGNVLTKLETPPDFDCDEVAVGSQVRFIHRKIDGDDFYFVSSGVPEAREFLCTFRTGEKGVRLELWWPDTGRIEPIAVFNKYDVTVGASAAESASVTKITLPISLDPYGSVFVVFRASAEPQEDHIVSVRRNGAALYSLRPILNYGFNVADVKQTADKQWIIEAGEKGSYDFATSAGRSLKAEIPQLPASISIEGPWKLEFPEKLGAPPHVTLDRLISWTEHPDPGVKYFSGTATYRGQFTLPAAMRTPDLRLYLDLGRVSVIAEVVLNGKQLGTFWKPPFRVDVTDSVKAGQNELEVRVVNLWPNRMIGDEHLPEDCEWVTPETDRDPFARSAGLVIASWPKWLVENKPRSSGRIAFTSWKHYTKDDPLLESGLLGPVRITARARVKLTS